jgi:hypothetical protein
VINAAAEHPYLARQSADLFAQVTDVIPRCFDQTFGAVDRVKLNDVVLALRD